MKDFRDMQVWQKSHNLALEIYKATASFPKDEIYGLTAQVRRAVVSIPTNIAEGCGRGSRKELKQFLRISMGSASEVEYHPDKSGLLSFELGYIKKCIYEKLADKIEEVKKMLAGYISKII